MNTRFPEDVIPPSDPRANSCKIIQHVADAHRPVLLTSRGRGVATVQDPRDYEKTEERCSFMRAVVKGLVELEQGHERSLAEVKKRLGRCP